MLRCFIRVLRSPRNLPVRNGAALQRSCHRYAAAVVPPPPLPEAGFADALKWFPTPEAYRWYDRVWRHREEVTSCRLESELAAQPTLDAAAVARRLLKIDAHRRTGLRHATPPGDGSFGGGEAAGPLSEHDALISVADIPADLNVRLWVLFHESLASSALVGAKGARKSSSAAVLTGNKVGENTAAAFDCEDPLAAFFTHLERLGKVDRETVTKSCRALQQTMTASSSSTALGPGVSELREALTPLYEKWFRESLSYPHGMGDLVAMREALLELQRLATATASQAVVTARGAPSNRPDASSSSTCEPSPSVRGVGPRDATSSIAECLNATKQIERSLTAVLRSWLSSTWLAVDELDWTKHPADVFERVQRCEAVQPFASLSHVRHRCAPTPRRHMFAFFHPSLRGSPLVMIQVALTKGIASNVDALLAEGAKLAASSTDDARRSRRSTTPPNDGVSAVDTAIFYSINSTQPGLKGIDLGHQLILSAVTALQRHRGTDDDAVGSITTFSTLSPIPGFMAWLKSRGARAAATPPSAAGVPTSVWAVLVAADAVATLPAQFIATTDRKPLSADDSSNGQPQANDVAVPLVPSFTESAVRTAIFEFVTVVTAAAESLLHDVSAGSSGAFRAKISNLKSLSASLAVGEPGAVAHSLAFIAALDVAVPVMRHWPHLRPGAKPKAATSASSINGDEPSLSLATTSVIEWLMRRLVAHYLVVQRRRGRALDPVANFHLGNGAVVHRVNLAADTSELGLRGSCGAMVNYWYDLPSAAGQAAQYGGPQHTIYVSPSARNLVDSN